MNKEIITEIIDTIGTHQSILLTAHHKLDADAAGSILALYHVLKAMGKDPHPITVDVIPEELRFLPGIEHIHNLHTTPEKNFIINLYNPDVVVDEVKYMTSAQGLLRIIVTPKKGMFTAKDLKIHNTSTEYDLVIVVDSGSQKNIGELYQDHKDVFEKAVVINIDHHVSNDHFGDINFIHDKASSACELVYHVIHALDPAYLTKEVATCLLAGIIADTGSFKFGNTSASAFSTASQLMKIGADQQAIIVNLFKKKKFETLKLWGKILTRVKTDATYPLLWSSISYDDIHKLQGTPDQLGGVLDELLVTYPHAELTVLFTEIEKDTVHVSMRAKNNTIDAEKICAFFGGGGHTAACACTLEKTSLEQAIHKVLEKIRTAFAETPVKAAKEQLPPEKNEPSSNTHFAQKIQNFFGK